MDPGGFMGFDGVPECSQETGKFFYEFFSKFFYGKFLMREQYFTKNKSEKNVPVIS
jgi:hypothetical protein